MNTPIALQMYTVRGLTPTPDAYRQMVRDLAEIGYEGIEGGNPEDMTPAEYRRFLDDLGLKATSVWGNPSASSIEGIVELATALDVSNVVCSFGSDHFADADRLTETATTLNTACDLLAPHGLRLNYHNHFWEFDSKIEGGYAWDALFDRCPQLGAELDLYWASNFGEVDVPDVVRRYAYRTPLFHVKDGPFVKGEPNTACGHGKMDLPACFACADPAELQWLIVELDNYVGGDENMMDAVRDSFTYLDGLRSNGGG